MHITCHTYYSLRYGVLSPERLVHKAAQWGVTALALTDANNTSAAGEFVERCREAGIKPILGISFWREEQWLYTGLAKNAEGWRELNELLTNCSLAKQPVPTLPPPLEHAWIIYPRLVKPIRDFRRNELLGIRPEHVNRLFSHELRHHQHKLVALCPVVYIEEEEYERHRLLRAIDLNTVLTKLTPRDLAKPNDRLLPPDTLRQFYQAYPAILRNTQRVIDSCTAELETGLQLNRQSFTGSKTGDFTLLEKLALHGCERRYGPRHQAAHQRTQRELRVIREQDFCAYFLITWDIIRYARSVGYHHVGRGSGANSIVAYNLGISDVDPLELDLYFERFINPYRASPPDFDIDFSWDERDDVTDYIFKRYGREHTALLATYSTFKRKAAIRELGKVYGLPKAEIDALVHLPYDQRQADAVKDKVLLHAKGLEGFPNHLSIHAGGIVISEKPLAYHTALQLMPKGFPVTHFDMHHGEDLGFHKFDILSQRGLGHIKDAVELVKRNQGLAVDIHDIPRIKTDKRVRAQLRSGQCIGCFYIESPAMRGLLTKLACDNYVHLVAASSIIRPGVAKSGMMREYIHRFHHPHSFRYPHPVFEEQLGETFGVMVYQEDVMKIVHHFAGLDLDESDVLRRIMSGKKFAGDTFERLRDKYFTNCADRGYPLRLAEEIWRQIVSFSGYSFCKAHSASFAVESFQSLYLKTYYPLEFMVAVINNFGGFYRTEIYVHEACKAGAAVVPPCVNHSHLLTQIEGTTIYLGFIHLNGFERQLAHRIVAERAQRGPFKSLADFTSRVAIGPEQLDLLIRIGAFRFTEKSKHELLWDKHLALPPDQQQTGMPSLFPNEQAEGLTHWQLPAQPSYDPPPSWGRLSATELEQAFDEMELLGFPLRSPFDLLATAQLRPKDYQATPAQYLRTKTGQTVTLLGYYVCQKSVRTVKGEHMAFGCWLDQTGQFFDTTHFPDFLRAYPFRGRGIYRLLGKVTKEFGFPSVEILQMERLAFVEDPRHLA